MPVLARYSSALRATLRGSREYGCRVSGSCTKKLQVSVLRWRNGSTRAVVTSGSSVMSDSWIDWKPLIDEPSNAMPPASDSSVTVRGRDGEVVHDAEQVAEPDVEDLDIVVLDVGDQLFGSGEHARAPCRR